MLYPELLAHVRRYIKLTEQEEELLCSRMELKRFKRKEHILEPGKHCSGEYFIIKGCVRQYMVNTKLNEQVIQFGLESWWIADHESLLNYTPAKTYIQTIEATEMLLLTPKDRAYLFEHIPKLESYFLIMMQKAFVASQRRIGFIFNMSDQERYRFFIQLFPAFANRVPQYMLASYLGFTPQFMSRLRAKKVK
ncbi:Crp/Fnr family transcriptional regulator [Mucilaginibacter myungsuensis]|uniref:Crp/Fnr family transcriptional regulator n=1 Tax=Mucilaginibacter myungsuensis TaxID=649104 RepID=A0A929L157_9SPHI|nr:Crp/Fnr family transcriptional regulator [Mucilaginibacter myungsuensis]MBE9664345.1 Crp/Fnr family transcriptional regulator [Mucilaginibacter myungsuensis]MDN3597055.1 Crp/Fnr family transcriptional regulator [Mucilaginibacter myungsuensis]